jgi:hypothetical protein
MSLFPIIMTCRLQVKEFRTMGAGLGTGIFFFLMIINPSLASISPPFLHPFHLILLIAYRPVALVADGKAGRDGAPHAPFRRRGLLPHFDLHCRRTAFLISHYFSFLTVFAMIKKMPVNHLPIDKRIYTF